MKKIFCFLTIFAFVFAACENMTSPYDILAEKTAGNSNPVSGTPPEGGLIMIAPVSEIAAPLYEGVWEDGVLASVNNEALYWFNVSAGKEYRVWWNDRSEGNSMKSALVVVFARYYPNGAAVIGAVNNTTSPINGWTTPQSFTADSDGVVLVRVIPYGRNALYVGAYGIVYTENNSTRPTPPWTAPESRAVLSESIWQDDAVNTANSEVWYKIYVSAGRTYRIWANNRNYGNYLKSGNVVVSAWYDDGVLIFGGTNTSDNYIWTTPQSFTPSADGAVYVRVIPYNRNISYVGTYGIVYTENNSTRPDVVWNNPLSYTTLIKDQWHDDSVYSADGEVWYRIEVEAGTEYRFWWNDQSQGDGAKSAYVYVSAWYSDGTNIFGNRYSGWGNPPYFTPGTNDAVYIRVVPYNFNGSYVGDFAIVYSDGTIRPGMIFPPFSHTPLSEDIMTNGSIYSLADEYWYSFDMISGQKYYLWWNDSYSGESSRPSLAVSGYYENGTIAFVETNNGWFSSRQINAFSNTTLYISVKSRRGTGTYDIGYTTINIRPGTEFPPPSAASLTADTWETNTLTNASEEHWYSIDVSSGSTYYVWWDDRYQGSGAYTADITVGAWNSDATTIFGGTATSVDSGYTTPGTITASSDGTVYIRVIPYNYDSSYAGTYAIVYSATNTRPD